MGAWVQRQGDGRSSTPTRYPQRRTARARHPRTRRVPSARALTLLSPVLLSSVLMSACGEPVQVGTLCLEGARDCLPEPPVVPTPGQFPASVCLDVLTEWRQVPAGAEVTAACELATLAGGRSGPAYVRGWFVSPKVQRQGQEEEAGEQVVVVRRAAPAGLEAFEDGPVDCAAVLAAADFQPFAVAEDSQRQLDYTDARAVPVTLGDRLLIVQRFLNQSAQAAEIRVDLRMDCGLEPPGVFLQLLSFEVGRNLLVRAGERRQISDDCIVDRDMWVTLLSRDAATDIEDVTLSRLPTATSGLTQLTFGTGQSSTTLQTALRLRPGDALRLECSYSNLTDRPVQLGSDAFPACSVAGLYQLFDGAADDEPLRCPTAME